MTLQDIHTVPGSQGGGEVQALRGDKLAVALDDEGAILVLTSAHPSIVHLDVAAVDGLLALLAGVRARMAGAIPEQTPDSGTAPHQEKSPCIAARA